MTPSTHQRHTVGTQGARYRTKVTPPMSRQPNTANAIQHSASTLQTMMGVHHAIHSVMRRSVSQMVAKARGKNHGSQGRRV